MPGLPGAVCPQAVCPPAAPGGPEGRRRGTLTIYELGVEYAMAAAMLQGRIRQLEELLEQAGDEGERQQLEGRIRPLRVMCRETRAVARHLQGYYLRGRPAREGRALRRRGR